MQNRFGVLVMGVFAIPVLSGCIPLNFDNGNGTSGGSTNVQTNYNPPGECILLAQGETPPAANAPDYGPGYARIKVSGMSDCTAQVYAGLAKIYCLHGFGAPTEQVLLRDDYGQTSLHCPQSGCVAIQECAPEASVAQAPAICILRDSYTSLPKSSDPDVGQGYAKVEVASKDDCTDAVKDSLKTAYCAKNTNKFQYGYATYDSNDNYSVTGCAPGAFDCHIEDCPAPAPAQATCTLRNMYSNLPNLTDVNLTTGYLQVRVSDKSECTDDLFDVMKPVYCSVAGAGMQFQQGYAIWPGPTSGCAPDAFASCNYQTCP